MVKGMKKRGYMIYLICKVRLRLWDTKELERFKEDSQSCVLFAWVDDGISNQTEIGT